jgi:hypothetical protein
MTDRRGSKRYPISLPLVAWDGDSNRLDGRTCDISARGLYFLADRRIKQNEKVLILTVFPGAAFEARESLLWAHCRVLRVEPRRVGGTSCTGVAAVIESFTMAEKPTARSWPVVRQAAESA